MSVSVKIVHGFTRAATSAEMPGSRVSDRSSCGVPIALPRIAGVNRGELGHEAPVETHLQNHACVVGRRDRPVGIFECQRHRLLAEHVLARVRGRDDKVGVGGGGRADRHRLHNRVGDQREWISVCPWGVSLGCGGFGIGDGHQGGVREPVGKCLGVKAADPAGADKAEA